MLCMIMQLVSLIMLPNRAPYMRYSNKSEVILAWGPCSQ